MYIEIKMCCYLISGHGGQGNTSIQKDTTAFSAYLTSVQTASTNAVVKLKKLWTNTMKAYDVTAGVFTASIPGLYHFAAVLMSESAKSFFFFIYGTMIQIPLEVLRLAMVIKLVPLVLCLS